LFLHSDNLLVCHIEDVKNTLELRNLKDGSVIQTFPLDVGTITGYSAKRQHTEFFFQFASFLSPGKIFHVDFQQAPCTAKVCLIINNLCINL
jgi:prolyl oligopeptidase